MCASGIDSETINLNTNASKTLSYTGAAKCLLFAKDGNYKFELWGANGGSAFGTYPSNGGYGGYTSGTMAINNIAPLYLYIGQAPVSPYVGEAYNGGGKTDKSDDTYGGGSGGGATDIRVVGGDWNYANGLRSRIMVAGAGGGGGWHVTAGGGAAGGLTAYSGGLDYRVGSQAPNIPATGGSQTSAGTKSGAGYSGNPGWDCYGENGGFGYGGNASISPIGCTNANGNRGGGGGSGWYGGGGGARGYAYSGGGGSSYISGHTGSVAVTSTSSSSSKSGCTTGTTNNNCSITPYINPATNAGYTFTNTVMIDGAGYKWTNTKGSLQAMPNPASGNYASGVGHSGNGYARITYLGTSI